MQKAKKMNSISHKLIFKSLLLVSSFLVIFYHNVVLSQTVKKEICFNFYIVTKETNQDSESIIYAKQKKLILNQLSQTQLVFDKNLERHCPEFQFSKGIVKQVTWDEAIRLSQPVDQGVDELFDDYLYRKLIEAKENIQKIVTKLNGQAEMEYRDFSNLHADRAIVKAESALQKLIAHRESSKNTDFKSLENLQLTIESAVEKIKFQLDSYDKKDSAVILKKIRQRISGHELVDQYSALSWLEGKLIFWNDIEAQNTSIELKNLLRHYRTPENQCLDVYVIPSGKTPSRTIKEVEDNGKWTDRGGAAMSSIYFPRTTAGRGHAILLTYNAKKTEYRLAHEFGHLLLGKGNAHEGRKEKDLMHENSRGGSYLDEMECYKISENAMTFFNDAQDRKQ